MMAQRSRRSAGSYLSNLVVIKHTAVLLGVAVVAAVCLAQVKGDVCMCPKGFVRRYLPSFCRCQCYKFVKDLASWAEAKVYCDAMGVFTKEEIGIPVKEDTGATLAEVGDKMEEEWLRKQLRRTEGCLGKVAYWLGAHDLQVKEKWKWAASHEYVKYFDWLPNQPNYRGSQNCLAIGRYCLGPNADKQNYGWFNDGCHQKRFYICEKRGWCIK